MGGAVAVYFEAAAVITALALLGQVLELRAREQHVGRDPCAPRPRTEDRPAHQGRRHRRGGPRRADRGRRPPARPARARRSRSTAWSARAARRSMNRWSPASPCRSTKEAGATLIAGTINQSGALVMDATRIGRDTMLAQIVQMVAKAQRSRAPIQRLADQVSGWFVPLVIVDRPRRLCRRGGSSDPNPRFPTPSSPPSRS